MMASKICRVWSISTQRPTYLVSKYFKVINLSNTLQKPNKKGKKEKKSSPLA
jgi:hypothetical protein